MTSITDIANRALSSIGTRSQIASLAENSNEAKACRLILEPLRDELLRLAPWNCATNYNTLALICAAQGTPENPTGTDVVWQKGLPPPPWSYEYAYPSDCLRPLWIVPQFSTGFTGIPITSAVTGTSPMLWQGPAVPYKVAIDQVTAGVPAVGGADTKVILTNQAMAILAYIKQVTNPDIWDPQFQQALVAALASRLVWTLTGNKELANAKTQEANGYITIARQGDGNEGLTVNDVTPDWIRVRGIDFAYGPAWGPDAGYNWGGMLGGY